ncbi:hypothetical protein [Porticoccus sp.]
MQLTLNFDASITEAYSSCREYVQARVHQVTRNGRHIPQKAIAADMDLSPSDLSRKLASAPGDPRAFSVDNLEAYINATGDIEPVLYLVAKYLTTATETELRRQLAAIEASKATA